MSEQKWFQIIHLCRYYRKGHWNGGGDVGCVLASATSLAMHMQCTYYNLQRAWFCSWEQLMQHACLPFAQVESYLMQTLWKVERVELATVPHGPLPHISPHFPLTYEQGSCKIPTWKYISLCAFATKCRSAFATCGSNANSHKQSLFMYSQKKFNFNIHSVVVGLSDLDWGDEFKSPFYLKTCGPSPSLNLNLLLRYSV